MIEANKTNLIIEGQGYLDTAIEWKDTSTGGTTYSSSVTIFASNFIAYNISFKVTKNIFPFLVQLCFCTSLQPFLKSVSTHLESKSKCVVFITLNL